MDYEHVINKIVKLLSLLNLPKNIINSTIQKLAITAKCDSAASAHYLMNEDSLCLTNKEKFNGPSVILPDSTKISPSDQEELPLPPAFSKAAKKTTVLQQLKSTSLVSVGPLCDDNKLVIFDKQKVRAI